MFEINDGGSADEKHLRTFAGIFAGNVSNALAVAAFIVPNSILIGGSTGISLTLQHAFGLELTVTVLPLMCCSLFWVHGCLERNLL